VPTERTDRQTPRVGGSAVILNLREKGNRERFGRKKNKHRRRPDLEFVQTWARRTRVSDRKGIAYPGSWTNIATARSFSFLVLNFFFPTIEERSFKSGVGYGRAGAAALGRWSADGRRNTDLLPKRDTNRASDLSRCRCGDNEASGLATFGRRESSQKYQEIGLAHCILHSSPAFVFMVLLYCISRCTPYDSEVTREQTQRGASRPRQSVISKNVKVGLGKSPSPRGDVPSEFVATSTPIFRVVTPEQAGDFRAGASFQPSPNRNVVPRRLDSIA